MTSWLELGRQIFYPKKTNLFIQGQPCEYIYVILDGTVKISIYLPNGEEKTLSFICGESIVDPASPMLGSNYHITATAFTDCTTIVINKHKINQLVQNDQKFANLLLMSLAKEVSSLGSYLISSSLPSASLKVASVLLRLSHQLSAKTDDNIIIDITHDELASMTSLSRVSVSNSLSLLEKENIISKSRGSIVFQKYNLKTWLKSNLNYLQNN